MYFLVPQSNNVSLILLYIKWLSQFKLVNVSYIYRFTDHKALLPQRTIELYHLILLDTLWLYNWYKVNSVILLDKYLLLTYMASTEAKSLNYDFIPYLCITGFIISSDQYAFITLICYLKLPCFIKNIIFWEQVSSRQ